MKTFVILAILWLTTTSFTFAQPKHDPQSQTGITVKRISKKVMNNKTDVPNNELEKILSPLNGSLQLIANKYNNTKIISSFTSQKGEVKTEEGKWKTHIEVSKVPNQSEALDFAATFKLAEGEVTSTGITVSFDFSKWSRENYVMVPAIVYNGNRFHIVGNGYNPTYTKEMFYNSNLPITMSNNPRLSIEKGKASKIELQTGNAATPAICFFSPSKKRGFIMLTEQKTRFGNNGLMIEENAAQDSISFKVTAPAVRELAAGFGDFFASGDKAANWNKGDSITLRFRLYSFSAQNIPSLLDKFMQVRKSLTGSNAPRNLVPMSKIVELGTTICSGNWITVPAGSYYTPENSKDFQLGWVSGMMNTYPMLALNNEKERERVLTELDFVVDKLQGKSGYFYGGITENGVLRTDKVNPEINTINVLVRKNNDALLWFMKHFMLLKEQGYGNLIKPKWENATKRLALAYINTWKKQGELGQYIDPETGKIMIFNSTASAAAPAGLALASQYFNEPDFLKEAIDIVNYYYTRDIVNKGYSGGYSGDTSQDPDADSAYGLLESIMSIYYLTDDPKWLEKGKTLANLGATFTLSYDEEFPPNSNIAKLNGHMAGAVWASVQNKHAAPGICTASGDYIFKLYRATGDKLYADLIRDIQHAHTEAVDMPDHRTTNYGFGTSMERIQPTDAEGRGSTGNFIHTRNSWTETNGMLMALEIPGIYLQTDKDEIYVFDHVEVTVVKRDSKAVTLLITNKTPYDAQISILAESAKQAKKPLGYTAFVHWPKVEVKGGKAELFRITNMNGKIKILNQN
ncbi:MAG: hypothetical protein HXX14_15810 [Bacteroidetes bacterium]|nr:hypothetical protein [Bacteroidota bacterium]